MVVAIQQCLRQSDRWREPRTIRRVGRGVTVFVENRDIESQRGVENVAGEAGCVSDCVMKPPPISVPPQYSTTGR